MPAWAQPALLVAMEAFQCRSPSANPELKELFVSYQQISFYNIKINYALKPTCLSPVATWEAILKRRWELPKRSLWGTHRKVNL